MLSKTEEENINYFEQLKKAYQAPRAKIEQQNEDNQSSSVPNFSAKPSKPTPAPRPPTTPHTPKPPVMPKPQTPPPPPKKD